MNNFESVARELITKLNLVLPRGQVVADPDVLKGYSHDHAGLVEWGTPSVLVRPRSTRDVQAAMRIATQLNVPVVPRGAGSGLAGGANAVDGCIVLCLEQMNRIQMIDASAMIAIVEPGVINGDLKAASSAAGLWYSPDPASYEFSTIGGNVATNAGGLCCVKYGVTRDSLLGLKVVLADGTELHTGSQARKSVAGLDLTSLFTGSEGTLGIITEVTVRLRPPPSHSSTLVAFFASLTNAGRAIVSIVSSHVPAMLELMDQVTIRAVEQWKPMGLDTGAAALLLASSDSASDELASIEASCTDAGATYIASTTSAEEGEHFMNARRLAYPALERQGATLLDDVAVPIDKIVPTLSSIQHIAEQYGIKIGTFGHGGDGNLHPTIVFDPLSQSHLAQDAFNAIIKYVLDNGGTITGEHGVGILKAPYLAAEVGPESLQIQQGIKALFDPNHLLNPGKVLGSVIPPMAS